ncbi:mitochondrial carrier protein [Nitzschia inconspicua]|uniref:Mitochondrial carrier protein n=1 Tax=Nitzschia inconspicua TaxID=303405 RepID=A0A9K3KE40_9STRA|nr:mitochondrial carrier protein [Nitzschia inconspicua]
MTTSTTTTTISTKTSMTETRRQRTALADAVAGVAATLISLWAFYPLEVIKTNLQATLQGRFGIDDNKKSSLTSQPYNRRHDLSSVLRQLQKLFRGCSTKTLHASASSFCYFFLYSFILSTYHRQRQQMLPTQQQQYPSSSESKSLHPSTRLVFSALAAILNTFLTLPLDVLSSQHAIETNNSIQKKECGNGELSSDVGKMNAVWNRHLASSTTVSPSSSSSSDEEEYESDSGEPIFHEALSHEPFLSSTELSSRGIGGSETECSCHSILSKDFKKSRRHYPTVTTLDQSLEVIDVDCEKTTNNKPTHSGCYSIREWAHLWKGLTPAVMLCSNPAIHYTVYDVLKNRMLSSDSPTTNHSTNDHRRLSLSQAFLLGVVAKFVATVGTYPLIRAKVLLMVTSESSLWSALVKSYRHDNGIRGLYKGCDWQLLHTLLKSALMMMVRERITEQTHRWIVGGKQ